ncbi:MAG: hypothetical protein C0514_03880 [Candidatus Puniceispirillum sp.]|nr:hypothetical protein [Candidatus Puniceispirillum sp.]
MKVASLAPLLGKKPFEAKVVCFYGSDEGLARLRTYMLGVFLGVREKRSLAHEAEPTLAAPSLWGGSPNPRCVILEKSLDQKGVEGVLTGQDVFVLTHGSLTTKSAFFKTYEAHKQVLLVACYEPNKGDLDAFITFLEEENLCHLTPAARAFLHTHVEDILPHLPGLFDKLMLMAGSGDAADVALLETLLPPLASQKHQLLTKAFLEPSRASLIQRLEIFSGKDADTFALTRQILSLVKMLHAACLEIRAGKAPVDAVRATRFPGFFGKESQLGGTLARHTRQSMGTLMTLLWDLEKAQKSTHSPAVLNERLLVRAHGLLHGGAPQKTG